MTNARKKSPLDRTVETLSVRSVFVVLSLCHIGAPKKPS